MASLAKRNLFHDKVRLAVTLTGIVFAVVLVAIQLGLFIGFRTATSNVIDNSGADIWIGSADVSHIEVAASMFGLTLLMCIGASVVSINKVTRIDPAMVFKG